MNTTPKISTKLPNIKQNIPANYSFSNTNLTNTT